MQNKIADQIIANQINLFRLTAGEQRNAIEIIRNLRQELVGRIAVANLNALNKKSIEKLINEIDNVVSDYYSKINVPVDAIAQIEARATTLALSPVNAVSISATVIKALGKDLLVLGSPLESWFKAQSDDFAFKFAAQVRQGFANGETNYQIIKRVKPLFDISERSISSIVHTSIQSIAGNARMAVFKENADVLNGIEQLSTLDSHTSITCIAYSGAKWDVNGNPIMGTTLPFNGGTPRHFYCRSVIIPIVKSLSELAGENMKEPLIGTRASDEGPISASTTMEKFLKGKPKEWADDLLGKGRAQLWRDGKLTLKDLLDQRGRPLTLEQLNAKYN